MSKIEEHILAWQKVGWAWDTEEIDEIEHLYKDTAPQWAKKVAKKVYE